MKFKIFLSVIFTVIFTISMTAQKTSIGGLTEVGIGATDEKPLIKYFERFGYRVGNTGELSAKEAKKLTALIQN